MTAKNKKTSAIVRVRAVETPKKKRRQGPEVCPHCGSVMPKVDPHANVFTNPMRDFTDRQLAVLRLVAMGYTAKEVGEELKISSRTVEFHRAVVMRKLNVKTVAEMTVYAMANMIVRVAS